MIEYKHTSSHCPLFCFAKIAFFFFNQLKAHGNPESNKSVSAIFPVAFAHLGSLCHILAILAIFQTFSSLRWWSVISDLCCYYYSCFWGAQTAPVWGSKRHCCLILRNGHGLRLLQPLPWSVSSRQHRGKTLHWQRCYNLLKAHRMAFFSNKVFLN